MRLGTAIECLFDNYIYASDKEWIRDKVAWALYQTWKAADNCESCRHWWKSEDVCLLDDCQYEPQTEPQKCYLRKSCDHYGDKQVCGRCREYNLYSHTTIEPKQGEWTEEPYDGRIYGLYRTMFKCSTCGYVPMYRGEPIVPTSKTLRFCPNCGARMKGADDETD